MVSVYFPIERLTVGVSRTGFEMFSVNNLCPISVKAWRALYGLSFSPNRATERRRPVNQFPPAFAIDMLGGTGATV